MEVTLADMYFESHAHYDDDVFDCDRDALLAQFPKAGIDTVINIGADLASSEKSIALARQYPFVYAAVGVHPHYAETLKDGDFSRLAALLKQDKVVAVGEIGLDYHYDNASRDVQVQQFKRQLSLAEELSLPVVIHSRDAAKQCFALIAESGVRKGVIHCYSGSAEMALDYVKMGFLIGIGGVSTFGSAKKVRAVIEAVPIESILLETDSPYLAPVPNRGARNDSRNLFYIAEKIAAIKGISHMEVADYTRNNGNKLFFH